MSLFILAGCDGVANSPSHNLRNFDEAYKQGKDARASMQRRGIAVSSKSCADMYASTHVEQDYNPFGGADEDYLAQIKTSYVNGCMNRPNTHGSPTSSTTPSPTASSRG